MRFARRAIGLLSLTLLVAGGPAAEAAPDKTVEEAFRDALTHAEVRAALIEKIGSYGLKIDIDVAGSRVTLKGDVKDQASLLAARKAAQSVSGVANVDVELRVNPALESVGETASQEARDALLAARVAGRLLAEIGANALRIEVKATDGIVSLSGTVPSPEVETLAVRKAKGTKGVRKVLNLLKPA